MNVANRLREARLMNRRVVLTMKRGAIVPEIRGKVLAVSATGVLATIVMRDGEVEVPLDFVESVVIQTPGKVMPR